jgi:hypothetical protein
MAILGGYRRNGGVQLPRVITIGISRDAARDDTRFTVRMHEEGTPVSWRRDVDLEDAAAQAFRDQLLVLDEWSEALRSDPEEASKAARRLGRRLYDTFLGDDGARFLDEHEPTALMIDADETTLNLPWELMADPHGPLSQRWPFGRLVTTKTRPRPERDPVDEDETIAVLAVVDPSKEFSEVDDELAALKRLGELGTLRLDVLAKDKATYGALADHVRALPYDVIHFSGHGGFSKARPGESGLVLADGPLRTQGILDLPWAKPPYMAIVSACWSGRSAPDRRLTSPHAGSNGVAAAFLAAGASSCLGFGWPVGVSSAAAFVEAFYSSLVDNVNSGRAVLDARQALMPDFETHSDLAALSAVYYGDVGTAQRRDLPTAEPPQPDAQPDPTRRDTATAS